MVSMIIEHLILRVYDRCLPRLTKWSNYRQDYTRKMKLFLRSFRLAFLRGLRESSSPHSKSYLGTACRHHLPRGFSINNLQRLRGRF